MIVMSVALAANEVTSWAVGGIIHGERIDGGSKSGDCYAVCSFACRNISHGLGDGFVELFSPFFFFLLEIPAQLLYFLLDPHAREGNPFESRSGFVCC